MSSSIRDLLRSGIAPLCLLFAACFGDTPNSPGENINLTGDWSGPIRLSVGADSVKGPLLLQILQESNSRQVTGKVNFPHIGESDILSGELKTTEFTVQSRREQSTEDDCHLYPHTWVFALRGTELRLQNASGQLCEGDGLGGHRSLRAITGASGILVLGS